MLDSALSLALVFLSLLRSLLSKGVGEKMLDQGEQQGHNLRVCPWALWKVGVFGVGSLRVDSMIMTGKTAQRLQ